MKSILYIEDNQDDAYAAICLFEGTDMNIRCVDNISAAFNELAKNTYDLIVSDMLMPGQDGLSFAKKLSTSDIETPFILTSGVAALRGFESYHGLKNYLGFMLKPITPEKIEKLWHHEI